MLDDITFYFNELKSIYPTASLKDQTISMNFSTSADKLSKDYIEKHCSLSIYPMSIRIFLYPKTSVLRSYSKQKILEITLALNYSLDLGAFKCEKDSSYVYYTVSINREGKSYDEIMKCTIYLINYSVNVFDNFLSYAESLKILDSDPVAYENFFGFNAFENWSRFDKKRLLSEKIDDLDRNTVNDDIEDIIVDDQIFQNNRNPIEYLMGFPDIWKYMDLDNFNEETLEYEYIANCSLRNRLKMYKFSKEYTSEVMSFVINLLNAGIELNYLPLNCFMAITDNNYNIISFRFSMNFFTPLELDPRFNLTLTQDKNAYISQISEAFLSFISQSLESNYSEILYTSMLLNIENLKLQTFNEMLKFSEGSFGTLYKNQYLSKTVIIKKPPNKADEEESAKKILRELDIIKKINNKHVITVYGVVKIENVLCLVMENCIEQNLRDEIKHLSDKMRVRIMKEVSIGMTAVHENKIIHGNIKPGNIFFAPGKEKYVKITNFSLAVKENEYKPIPGLTRGYASPEQLIGCQADFPGDVWSYGMTYYHLLEKKSPLYFIKEEGVTEDLREPLYWIFVDKVKRPKITMVNQEEHEKECFVIRGCWKTKTQKRLKFTEITEILDMVD